VPEVVIAPVGSGGNIVAQHMGFNDLVQMGITDRMPSFVSVQIAGADPVNIGYRRRQFDEAVLLEEPAESKAEAIASDTCFNYFKIMRILRETSGEAVSVTDGEIDNLNGFDHMEYSSKSAVAALPHLERCSGKSGDIVLIGTAASKLSI